MKFIIQLVEFSFTLLESALRFLFEFLEVVIKGIPKKNEGFHADFAPASALFSSSHKGFCLTGKSNLSVKLSYQNAMAIGGTGSGKTSVVLIPSLYTMDSSFVVHDPSGECFAKSAGFLAQRGYIVKTLNFANPEKSCGYNPLIRTNSSSDIQKVASMLVENSFGNSKDPFWSKMAVSLIGLLLTILKKEDRQYQNLYNLRLLLNYIGSNPEKIDSLFAYADMSLYTEFQSFCSYDEKVVSGTVASCKSALIFMLDEAVAKVTSFDTLNLEDFRKRKVALFIQNSVADQRYYSVLTSIFFEQFFAYILSRFPKEDEQDVFFLVDEASSLKFPTLPLSIANVRKHRAGIMLVVQDFNQLVHCYGKHEGESLRSNCFAKLYFNGQGLETATELERIMGKYEYIEKDNLSVGQSGKKHVRPLMLADEIRTMRLDRALLICGHYPPIMAKLRPYYKNSRYVGYSKLSPPELNSQLPFVEIPILPIEVIPENPQ